MRKLWVLVVMMVACGLANGTIIYSGLQDISLSEATPNAFINIAGDSSMGWDDFHLEVMGLDGMGIRVYHGNNAGIQPGFSIALMVIDPFSLPLVQPVPDFFPVDSSPFFDVGVMGPAIVYDAAGYFDFMGGGYMGFQMLLGGVQPAYGWIHVEGVTDPFTPTETLTIDGWAFDDTGNPIAAGAVPEPASAMMLLFGSGAALSIHRLRRKARCR
jgi:hypothetical protein